MHIITETELFCKYLLPCCGASLAHGTTARLCFELSALIHHFL